MIASRSSIKRIILSIMREIRNRIMKEIWSIFLTSLHPCMQVNTESLFWSCGSHFYIHWLFFLHSFKVLTHGQEQTECLHGLDYQTTVLNFLDKFLYYVSYI